MSYLLYATLIVGWMALAVWLMVLAVDNELWFIALAIWAIISIALVVKSVDDEEKTGPCLREETGYMYNPGTKTMMPYTYCAERGVWKTD